MGDVEPRLDTKIVAAEARRLADKASDRGVVDVLLTIASIFDRVAVLESNHTKVERAA